MARDFTGATPWNNYLSVDQSLISSGNCSLSCWIYPTYTGQLRNILRVQNDNDAYALRKETSDYVSLRRTDGNGSNATSSATVTTNSWHHIGGVVASTTSGQVWLNGANTGTDSDTRNVGSLDRFFIGDDSNSSWDQPFAECAVWNVALTEEEIKILAEGYSALFVRPQNLIMYAPFINNDKDIVSGLSFSLTGTIQSIGHVPIIYPATPQINPLANTLIEASQVGAYIESQTKKSEISQVGAYVEIEKISSGISQVGAYIEVSQSLPGGGNYPSDDVQETDDGTGFVEDGAYVTIEADTSSAVRKNAAFRFPNLQVPNGATIVYSSITLQAESTSYDDISSTVYGEDTDDSDDFVTTANINSRQLTSASVDWTIDSAGTVSIESPDIQDIIQEIVDRDGWASGNALTIIIKGKNSANKKFRAKSIESLSGAQAYLYVLYTLDDGEANISSFILGIRI